MCVCVCEKNTQTHKHIYMYMYICVYVCTLFDELIIKEWCTIVLQIHQTTFLILKNMHICTPHTHAYT